MSPEETQQIVRILKEKGIRFEVGLSDSEVVEIESKFAIKFPDDLKSFLQVALPVSEQFENWRQGIYTEKGASQVANSIDWPLYGMLFDLKNNVFWVNEWGEKPNTCEEQEIIVRNKYLSFPKLIPVYSHRYIPSDPIKSGNPVFSVYQMDIIDLFGKSWYQ